MQRPGLRSGAVADRLVTAAPLTRLRVPPFPALRRWAPGWRSPGGGWRCTSSSARG